MAEKKPRYPGERLNNAQDITIERSLLKKIVNDDSGVVTLKDAILKPVSNIDYTKLDGNPSEFIILNAENGVYSSSVQKSFSGVSKNHAIFGLSEIDPIHGGSENLVDVYHAISNSAVDFTVKPTVFSVSNNGIGLDPVYSEMAAINAVTYWGDKFIYNETKDIYLKVNQWSEPFFTFYEMNIDDFFEIGDVISIYVKSQDKTKPYWRNVPVASVERNGVKKTTLELDNHTNDTVTAVFDTDHPLSDLQIGMYVGLLNDDGTHKDDLPYFGAYGYTAGSQTWMHVAEYPSGGDGIIGIYFKAFSISTNKPVNIKSFTITFYDGTTISFNHSEIGKTTPALTLAQVNIDESITDNMSVVGTYKLYYHPDANINSYIRKGFFDQIVAAEVSGNIFAIIQDQYSYSKNNILASEIGGDNLQLSTSVNILDSDKFDNLVTIKLVDVGDYSSFGVLDKNDFVIYDSVTFKEVDIVTTVDINNERFLFNTSSFDEREYYVYFPFTGHAWKIWNTDNVDLRSASNDTRVPTYATINNVSSDNFPIKDSDGSSMSLADAIRGGLTRTQPIEIKNIFTANEKVFIVTNDSTEIFSIDAEGDVIIAGTLSVGSDLTVSGDIINSNGLNISYIDLAARLASLSGNHYDNDSEKIYARKLPDNILGSTLASTVTVGTLAQERKGAASFINNGFGYVGYGYGLSFITNLEKFNPVTNIATVIAGNAVNIGSAKAFYNSTDAYIYGSLNSEINQTLTGLVFNFVAETFTVAVLPSQTHGYNFAMNSAMAGTAGYMFGGKRDDDSFSNEASSYSISTSTWSSLTAMPVSNSRQSAMQCNHYTTMLFGGENSTYSILKFSNNSWTSYSSPISLFSNGAAIKSKNYGLIYCKDFANGIQKYDISNNIIKTIGKTNHGVTTTGMAGFQIDDIDYLCGGSSTASILKTTKIHNVFNFGPLFISSSLPSAIFSVVGYENDDQKTYRYDSEKNDESLKLYSHRDNAIVKYRKYGDSVWSDLKPETFDDNISISQDANNNYVYEFGIEVPFDHNFNTANNVWVTVSYLNVQRRDSQMLFNNGYFYNFFGKDDTAVYPNYTLTSYETYDSVINLWTYTYASSFKRYYGASSCLNDMCYLIGGMSYSGDYDPPEVVYEWTDISKFDPITGSFSNIITSIPVVNDGAAIEVDGEIIVARGSSNQGIFKFNDVVATQVTLSNYPIVVASMSSFEACGNGYIVGQSYLNQYDKLSDIWATRQNLSTSRIYLGTYSLNDKGYVAGGYAGTIYSNTDRYDPITNSWLVLSELSTGYFAAAGAASNNFGLISGGADTDNFTVKFSKKYIDSYNKSLIKGIALKIID